MCSLVSPGRSQNIHLPGGLRFALLGFVVVMFGAFMDADDQQRISAGRGRFSDPVESNSVRAAVGLAAGASSSRIVNEIRRRFGSTSNTLIRTTSPGFATLRGSLT